MAALALIFVLDLLAPPGLGVPLLYVPALAGLGLAAAGGRGGMAREFHWAAGASLLMLAGMLLAPAEAREPSAWSQRGLTAAALWTVAVLARRQRQTAARLSETRAALAQADRGKTRFLAAASHDLRHPIQAALLFQDLLMRRLKGSPNEPLVRDLGLSLTMLQSMLATLLDIARLDAGTVRPRPSDFPLGPLLEQVGRQFQPAATAAGLRLRVVRCRALVRSDPELLNTLLQNLVANAVRFTQHGGVVVGCRRRGSRLAIQVWDSGCGIPADQLEAVFEEFHQIAPAGPGRSPGLGLGLALVRRLAAVLEHPLALRSQPDRGSVFELSLPVTGRLPPVPGSRSLPAKPSAA
jgi:two-component system CheB/CheR fusion protein